MADLYLDRAENEIAKLYADNERLRTENIQLKNEMMSREIERLTGDRFEFHGELGDKVPALTSDEASLLVLRGALQAATAEVGKLRAQIENEQLKEQINLTVLNANQIEMKRLRVENERLCGLLLQAIKQLSDTELIARIDAMLADQTDVKP